MEDLGEKICEMGEKLCEMGKKIPRDTGDKLNDMGKAGHKQKHNLKKNKYHAINGILVNSE